MAASAVIPYFARKASSFPCSMKRSGQPIRTTGVVSPRLFSSSKMALPNPPRSTWSSSVRRRFALAGLARWIRSGQPG